MEVKKQSAVDRWLKLAVVGCSTLLVALVVILFTTGKSDAPASDPFADQFPKGKVGDTLRLEKGTDLEQKLTVLQSRKVATTDYLVAVQVSVYAVGKKVATSPDDFRLIDENGVIYLPYYRTVYGVPMDGVLDKSPLSAGVERSGLVTFKMPGQYPKGFKLTYAPGVGGMAEVALNDL